jgi:hypothetical protein
MFLKIGFGDEIVSNFTEKLETNDFIKETEGEKKYPHLDFNSRIDKNLLFRKNLKDSMRSTSHPARFESKHVG